MKISDFERKITSIPSDVILFKRDNYRENWQLSWLDQDGYEIFGYSTSLEGALKSALKVLEMKKTKSYAA